MPLTRRNVTIGSQDMLPTYVIGALALGVLYTFDPLGRNAGNIALQFPAAVMPVPIWGCGFLALAALMCWAMRHWYGKPVPSKHSDRRAMVFALWMAAVAMLIWTACYLGSVVFYDAPLTAPLWPLFAARCCRASARSLLKGEV